MFKDFKAFVMRGNVLDLAVAVIIGAAFGAIVTSMVNDIVMPPIGLILGHVDFKELFVSLNGRELCDSRGRQGCRGSGHCVRTVFEHGDQFSDCRFCDLSGRPDGEQTATRAPCAAAPTTKDCAFCFTGHSDPARRCPHCTSQLNA